MTITGQGSMSGQHTRYDATGATLTDGTSEMHVYPHLIQALEGSSPYFTVGGSGGNMLSQSGWNERHAIFGNMHMWFDTSGRVRVKNGAPTSATDGELVGAQS
jgi:hypothetical protein